MLNSANKSILIHVLLKLNFLWVHYKPLLLFKETHFLLADSWNFHCFIIEIFPILIQIAGILYKNFIFFFYLDHRKGIVKRVDLI